MIILSHRRKSEYPPPVKTFASPSATSVNTIVSVLRPPRAYLLVICGQGLKYVRSHIVVDRLEWAKLRAFLPVSIAFSGAVFANVKTLQFAHMEAFIVFRALTPISSAYIEFFERVEVVKMVLLSTTTIVRRVCVGNTCIRKWPISWSRRIPRSGTSVSNQSSYAREFLRCIEIVGESRALLHPAGWKWTGLCR